MTAPPAVFAASEILGGSALAVGGSTTRLTLPPVLAASSFSPFDRFEYQLTGRNAELSD